MTTTSQAPVETFYDVPSWYKSPTLPKGHVGFGMIPPRKVHCNHHEKRWGVEGRITGAGAGTLVMFITIAVVLLMSTLAPTLLTNGLAFFGLN